MVGGRGCRRRPTPRRLRGGAPACMRIQTIPNLSALGHHSSGRAYRGAWEQAPDREAVAAGCDSPPPAGLSGSQLRSSPGWVHELRRGNASNLADELGDRSSHAPGIGGRSPKGVGHTLFLIFREDPEMKDAPITVSLDWSRPPFAQLRNSVRPSQGSARTLQLR